MIKNYYFTYGTSTKMPFQKGWTKIEAPSRKAAVEIFRAYHPDINEGIINCSSIYDEDSFKKTTMWSEGNFGAHEVEVILMQHIEVEEYWHFTKSSLL